jgi:hypothetical protein
MEKSSINLFEILTINFTRTGWKCKQGRENILLLYVEN